LEVRHTEADTFEDFGLVVAAFNLRDFVSMLN